MPTFFGQLIRPLRAGEEKILLHHAMFDGVPNSIEITSPVFTDGGRIPALYTVEAADISPALAWSKIPAGTQELALVVEDYDVPFPQPLMHLLAYGISPTSTGLAENALPSKDHPVVAGLLLGKNSLGHQRYDGPAPIVGHGPHHYVFQVLAFAETLLLEEVPDKKMFLEAIKDKTILATGALVGTYER